MPVLGIALAYALPPTDEYAFFERVGHRLPSLTELGRDKAAPELDGSRFWGYDPGVFGRSRSWSLQMSEEEAVRTVDEFLKRHPKWDRSGGGSGFSSEGGGAGITRSAKSLSSIYTNDETGDQLEFERETQVKPFKKLLKATVTVAQTKSSLQLWPKLKRWARLTFTR